MRRVRGRCYDDGRYIKPCQLALPHLQVNKEKENDSMTTNTIVTDAVKATNESNQRQVVEKAQRIIAQITAQQATIRVCEERIAGFRKEVSKIADGSVTIAKVMGNVALPSDGNPNTATILKAIDEANKAGQDTVKIASTNLVADINRELANIDNANKAIADLRKGLLELSVASVTVPAIMGS